MPATPLMIFAYVGHLAERGTIAAGSLQPYLSAINRYHADAGHERPALGHFITAARQGMARAQALVETRDTRVPLLAEHVVRVLLEALRASSTLAALLGKRGAAEYLRRRY
eukprot:scaffold30165_cov83-Phaeocystis_antarctica.AAC.1